MAAPRFFVTMPLSREAIGTEVSLPDPVAHHALRVLRLTMGDAVSLFDGQGGEYAATLTRATKREAWARVDAFADVTREPALELVLAQAIVASDTMDLVVRRAVELGVAQVQPLATARSARLPAGAQAEKRLAHWRQIAIAACEQCGRNRVPKVAPPVSLAHWLGTRSPTRRGIVLDPTSDAALASAPAPERNFDLLVGPEGGFASEEIAQAVAAGMHRARLGPRVLRADTASLAALAAANLLWGDFR